jgi:uncharacterized membrane protein
MIRLYSLYLPLLMILVSVPMVMRRVPPNGLYGFRTPKTLSNPQIWYEANRLAGVNLIIGAVLTMLFCGAALWRFGAARAAGVPPLVLFVMILVSVVVSSLQLRQM